MPTMKLAKRGGAAKPARDDGLFGAAAPGRRCGDCTVCCVALGIEDAFVRKAAGTPCQHLTGRGCGVYELRPDTCRTWECLWKRSGAVPTEARPDRLGAMFYFEATVPPRFACEHGYFVAHSLSDAAAFETAAFKAALAGLVKRFPHVPVWLSAGGQKTCVHPPAPLQQAVEGQSRDPALLAEAVRWIEGYRPLANATAGAHSWFQGDGWRSRYAPPAAGGLTFGGPLRFT